MEVNVVDSVGAGDSFDAGFVYGFLSRYDIEKCLKIGCICGSMNTTKAGGIAGQIYKADLRMII
jgi:sugar/nucleoside kinase (ribokinase family)